MAQKNARTEKYGSQTTGKKKKEKKIFVWCRILNSGAMRVGRRGGCMWSWKNDERGAKCLGHVPVWQ
jgi:hypothetical protein